MDNLNTHTPSSLYCTFAPPEALRILKQLELHYTPVHGSWLNMAEIELSALAGQCLCRRMGTQVELERVASSFEPRLTRLAIPLCNLLEVPLFSSVLRVRVRYLLLIKAKSIV